MYDKTCLFCRIVAGEEPCDKVLETDDFLVIKNKYPMAPIHVLVLDKQHREKQDTLAGVYSKSPTSYWDKMFATISATITQLGLDKTDSSVRGYKLVNNGAGYNHFEHEHFHVLGGSKAEPGGST